MGREVANWIPFEDGIRFAGQVGLVLLVMEGGLSVPLKKLRQVGILSFLIASSGTAIPVLRYACTVCDHILLTIRI